MAMQKSEGAFSSHNRLLYCIMFIMFILSLLFGLVWFLVLFCWVSFFALNSRLKGKKVLGQ